MLFDKWFIDNFMPQMYSKGNQMTKEQALKFISSNPNDYITGGDAIKYPRGFGSSEV